MAQIKYVKKTGEQAPVEGKRSSARQAAAAETEAQKPVANTKAKVTKKPASNGTAKSAAAATKKAAPKKAPTKSVSKRKQKGLSAKLVSTDLNSAAAAKTSASKVMKEEAPVETKPKASRKRKASEEPAIESVKKVKVAPKGPVINQAPTEKLDVYVFGEGSSGELGLGTKKAIDVKRPRLNANLASNSVGVVQIAAGGMHVAALTHDNKILTWGVNDQGALGRDTTWEGGLKDMDAESDSEDDGDEEADLNPRECTPTAIPSDKFPGGTTFVQVAAGDSTTFALTDDGQVWGWGTFRVCRGTADGDSHH